MERKSRDIFENVIGIFGFIKRKTDTDNFCVPLFRGEYRNENYDTRVGFSTQLMWEKLDYCYCNKIDDL